MSVIRVGYVFDQVGWLGGINYFRNLFAAIKSLPNAQIQPVVFTGMKSDVSAFDGLAEIVRTPIFDRKTLLWWINTFIIRIFPKRNILLYFLLRKNKIDVISHYGPLWKGCSLPSIGWIPDFQHLHLPQFFSKKECVRRDELYLDMMNRCSAVLLSSQDALNDLGRLNPENKTPTYILRFISFLDQNSTVLLSRTELIFKYKLDRPWFHIPNQFWAHKNHKVVVEAMHLLKEKGMNTLMIATGSTSDYRNAEYFPSLMKLINDYGLQDDFRVLGVLPYPDVIALMKYSVAVINPSLFEGWSTSVEESKCLGKTVLLSDIAVHREQSPEWGDYFNVDDHEELAKKMAVVIQHYDEKKEVSHQHKAELEKFNNVSAFAAQYKHIIFQVIK